VATNVLRQGTASAAEATYFELPHRLSGALNRHAPAFVLTTAVGGKVELHDMRYRRSTSSNGGTKDGLETVGPVCAVG
jgi:hypothetical protein